MLSVLGVVVDLQGHRDLEVSVGASSSSTFLAGTLTVLGLQRYEYHLSLPLLMST